MIRSLGIGLAVVVVLTVAALLQALPYYPIDAVGWGILIGLVGPLVVFVETAGEALFAPRRTKVHFPGGRAAALLTIALLALGAVMMWDSIGSIVAPHFRAIGS